MEETGYARFPGNLDPRAQEFRPTTHNNHNHLVINNNFPEQIPLFGPPPLPAPPLPPQLYYSYPPPPPLPQPVHPFSETVGFSQFHPPAASYVSSVFQPPPLPHPGSPTRTLVLSSVPTEASETLIRRELEVFGEVRGVQMERIYDGVVTVHFYDLRHAEKALKEIREQHMQNQARLRNFFVQNSGPFDVDQNSRSLIAPPLPPARGLIAGCVVWAQFVIPSCNAVPDGQNQGTLVVFNLDPNISSRCLKEIFQTFGAVKELRETPLKKQQRFVEFYDVRDAAKALKEMDKKEIYGRQVDIEFSRPGGHGRKFFNATSTSITSFTSSPVIVNSSANIHHAKGSTNYVPPPPPAPPLPLGITSRAFLSQSTQSSTTGKKTSNNNSCKGNPNGESIHGKGGSIEAYSVRCLSLSTDAVGDHGILLEKVAADGATLVPPKRSTSKKTQNIQSSTTAKQQQQRTSGKPWKAGKQGKKFDTRFLICEDSMVESNSTGDSRTTVMIKNIPNKYSQKLLLNMLDNHCIHCNEQIANGEPFSSYDFVYLPIDFNNKCNVGYGFVNMTSPQAAWRLYKAFHNQHWEVFNSRKICAVTYARVQGLEALKEHFKNSKFPSEMDHYLPVVFSPPRDGRQLTEPLPIVSHKQLQHHQQPIDILGHHPINRSAVHEIDGQDDDDDDDDDESLKNSHGSTGGDHTEPAIDQHLKYCSISSSSTSQNGGDNGDDDDS